ncbi:MAG: AMP-binding protein [Planctomycetaceae bacterium]
MTAAADRPEHLSQPEIRRLQFERLSRLLAEVALGNAFWKAKFASAGFKPASVETLDDLAQLPVTTKDELVHDQELHPHYGSNLTYKQAAYSRMHQTSGTTGSPLRWLDTPQSWEWFMQCWSQIYRMVGLRQDDVLAFPFSFGPFIGFWAAFEGATRLGNLSLAAGGMSSQARLKLIEENRATVVCCTPTYALRLAEVATQEGFDLRSGSVRALIVAGEPGGNVPATRQRIETAWGARLFDHWGMTEIGSLAVECLENPGGMHVLETECIAEIVDPQTLQPVQSGAQGELLITNLGRIGSPLIRYRTGDLVKADPNPCPCGRKLLRLEGGILGRCDDMVSIRGNNVFPTSLEAILREYDDVVEYRIVVETRRAMPHLRIEIEPSPQADIEPLLQTLSRAVKDRLNFQAEIIAVPADTLPRFELKGRRFVRES